MLLGSDLAAVLSSPGSRAPTPLSLFGSSSSPASSRRLHLPVPPLSRQRSPLVVQRAATASPGILRPSDECHHFHYDLVELGPVCVQLAEICPQKGYLVINVKSNGQTWQLRRSQSEMVEFDRQLHRCVFDRRHSRLEELCSIGCLSESVARDYLARLSLLTGSLMRCYSVLTFLELDNRGNHFLPVDHSPINVPAVACAVAVRPFRAVRSDQLDLQVGDIVSVVEMRVKRRRRASSAESGGVEEDEAEEEQWMSGKLTVPCGDGVAEEPRSGKQKFGCFPADCVRLFSDRLSLGEQLWLASNASCPGAHPRPTFLPSASPLFFFFQHRLASSSSSPHPIPHHPFRFSSASVSFPRESTPLLRSFFSRLTHRSASSSNAIFGMDLVKLAKRRSREVPEMVEKCLEVVERSGMEAGIYRQCGVQSNVRRLRKIFNSGRVPRWDSPSLVPLLRNDIHSVGSLLKQFFRQLPNPLVPFEHYPKLIDNFVKGSSSSEKELILRMRKLVREFPSAHFRTAKRLFLHLNCVSRHPRTRSNAQNLAILWTPNLIRDFRCPPATSIADCRLQMTGLDLHTDICAFLITFADKIFSESIDSLAENEVSICEVESPIGSEKYKNVMENGKIPPEVHSVIERPNKRAIMKGQQQQTSTIMAHSANGILDNERRWNRPKRKMETRDGMIQRLARSESADMGTPQTPLERSKLFTSLGKGLESVGQTIFRRVRSIRLTVRRLGPLKRGRGGGGEKAGTDSAEGAPDGRAGTSAAGSSISASGSGGALLLGIPFADSDANSNSNKLSPSSSANSSDPSTVKGPAASSSRRVNFRRSTERREEEADEEEGMNTEEEEGEEEEDERRRRRRDESVDSVPLDISRYDNVTSIVIAVPPSQLTSTPKEGKIHPSPAGTVRINSPHSGTTCTKSEGGRSKRM